MLQKFGNGRETSRLLNVLQWRAKVVAVVVHPLILPVEVWLVAKRIVLHDLAQEVGELLIIALDLADLPRHDLFLHIAAIGRPLYHLYPIWPHAHVLVGIFMAHILYLAAIVLVSPALVAKLPASDKCPVGLKELLLGAQTQMLTNLG